MTLSEKQQTFALNVAKLIIWANENGYKITLGEALRTKEQQAIYVKTGKSKTMNSGHLNKLAIDLNLFYNGEYLTSQQAHEPLHEYWETLHPDNKKIIPWDANHYQMD
jgi:hypothetical protein